MLNTDIIQKLLQVNFVPNNITPIAILLGGSYLLNINHEHSDFDIMILVSNEDFIKYHQFNDTDNHIYIDNVYIHFYLWPENILLNPHLNTDIKCLLWNICARSTHILTKNDFLIINDEKKLEAFINNWADTKLLLKLKQLYVDSEEFHALQIIKNTKNYEFKRLYYYLYLYEMLTKNSNHMTKQLHAKILPRRLNIHEPPNRLFNISAAEAQFIDSAIDFILNWVKK